MTNAELTRMYIDHMTRGGELATDQVLARAVLCRHARSTGRIWSYLQ